MGGLTFPVQTALYIDCGQSAGGFTATWKCSSIKIVPKFRRDRQPTRYIVRLLLGCQTAVAQAITYTSPCNEHPEKPHFISGKVGFTRLYVISLIWAQTHRVWLLVRTALEGGSNEHPQSMLEATIRRISLIINWKMTFLESFKVALYCIDMFT